jgi:hypothetical protein
MMLYQVSKWLELRMNMQKLADSHRENEHFLHSCMHALDELDEAMLLRIATWMNHDLSETRKLSPISLQYIYSDQQVADIG